MIEIFTIGHSTRTIEAFIASLRTRKITSLADVRTIPRSRHNPQFEGEALAGALQKVGIRYTHIAALGGLRTPVKNSPNGAWRNSSFRGYADYMQTKEFEKGLQTLLGLAGDSRTAIMCAEAAPWRCHRMLLSDALLALGAKVFHIVNDSDCAPHTLTAWAKISGNSVVYPPQDPELDLKL